MSHSPPHVPHCPHNPDWVDPRVELTQKRINWERLSTIACDLHKVTSANWGALSWGGFNLIRFLHLHDPDETTIVARVPLRPLEVEGEVSSERERAAYYTSIMSSEVATMEYIETYTHIPIPHIIYHSVMMDGEGVGSPYILMSKVDGVPLSSVWDDMEDDKRDEVIRQVIDILLELSLQRFDKIGPLFKKDPAEGGGKLEEKEAWCIKPMPPCPDDSLAMQIFSSTLYTSGTDCQLAHTNAYIQDIIDNNFGEKGKAYTYAFAWFIRSLIPALFDPSLDAKGFPLCPGDFHSQNIMITQSESGVRITAVIDWERTETTSTSFFAQYPFFIVDHPVWEEDHPLRSRNARDQTSFNKLIREAESRMDPEGGQPLSRAFENSLGPYLFQQCIQDPVIYTVTYPQLFALVFGEDSEDFSVDYYIALMENGILRKETEQFNRETEVWKEAVEILGEDLVRRDISRAEFKILVEEHSARFEAEGKVREWLSGRGE